MGNKKARIPMPVAERAKQFAPFSPLDGLGKRLAEIEKPREAKRECSEEMKDAVNRKLHALRLGQTVTAIYYDQSEQQYVHLRGRFDRLDAVTGVLWLADIGISLEMLYDLAADDFVEDLL